MSKQLGPTERKLVRECLCRMAGVFQRRAMCGLAQEPPKIPFTVSERWMRSRFNRSGLNDFQGCQSFWPPEEMCWCYIGFHRASHRDWCLRTTPHGTGANPIRCTVSALHSCRRCSPERLPRPRLLHLDRRPWRIWERFGSLDPDSDQRPSLRPDRNSGLWAAQPITSSSVDPPCSFSASQEANRTCRAHGTIISGHV